MATYFSISTYYNCMEAISVNVLYSVYSFNYVMDSPNVNKTYLLETDLVWKGNRSRKETMKSKYWLKNSTFRATKSKLPEQDDMSEVRARKRKLQDNMISIKTSIFLLNFRATAQKHTN